MLSLPVSFRRLSFVSSLVATIAFAGAALGATAYVGDLDGLKPVSTAGFDEAYGKDGALPKGYKSVYVAPVGVIAGQDQSLDGLSPADRQVMQDYLYRQLTRQLGAKFTLAPSPGPGVLVIDASFTALTSNKPTLSAMNKKPDIDYMRSFGIGKAGVQIDVKDGGNSELLAAFVDHEAGDDLRWNTNKNTLWGDAEEFSRDWASQLTDALGG